MSEIPKVCFDRILPKDLRHFSRMRSGAGAGMPTRMAVLRAKKWPNGSVLRVRFLEGSAAQRQQVREVAQHWSEHANLRFLFNDAPDAEIRIAFADRGSWSYIGTDCLDIPRDSPTMNFGWLDQGVILHEFGHAIGLIHEHQNPLGGIRWDRQQVIRDLSGPPNLWDLDTIEHNMFQTYDRNQINGTQLDPRSIMLYAIPTTWTLDDFHSAPNQDLSATDKSFIGTEVNYPFPEPHEELAELPVTQIQEVTAEISVPGEQDLYTFVAGETGRYTVETEGPTDVVLALFGPDSRTRLVGEDDDGGAGHNARLAADLEAGRYYVQVRHFDRGGGVGSYTVRVLH